MILIIQIIDKWWLVDDHNPLIGALIINIWRISSNTIDFHALDAAVGLFHSRTIGGFLKWGTP